MKQIEREVVNFESYLGLKTSLKLEIDFQIYRWTIKFKLSLKLSMV